MNIERRTCINAILPRGVGLARSAIQKKTFFISAIGRLLSLPCKQNESIALTVDSSQNLQTSGEGSISRTCISPYSAAGLSLKRANTIRRFPANKWLRAYDRWFGEGIAIGHWECWTIRPLVVVRNSL